MSLNGKCALITGSSRGIGRGIVLKLAEQGVKVAINYRGNEAAAKETLTEVQKMGSDGFIIQADVSRPEDMSRMFSTVEAEFGSLDIFVSNARPEIPEFYQPPMDVTLDSWNNAFDSQARAFLLGAQEASPERRRTIGLHFAAAEAINFFAPEPAPGVRGSRIGRWIRRPCIG